MGEAFAWACVSPNWTQPPNYIHEGTVRTTRFEAMQAMGVYHREGETISQGWRRAYRAGWRACRVVIRRCGSTTPTPETTSDGEGGAL